MSVDKVARRGPQKLAQLHDSVNMARVVGRKRKAGKPFRQCAPFQFALFAANDELPMASALKAPRQTQQLALPAAQVQAGVEMADP
jgi:hypothetical protein